MHSKCFLRDCCLYVLWEALVQSQEHGLHWVGGNQSTSGGWKLKITETLPNTVAWARRKVVNLRRWFALLGSRSCKPNRECQMQNWRAAEAYPSYSLAGGLKYLDCCIVGLVGCHVCEFFYLVPCTGNVQSMVGLLHLLVLCGEEFVCSAGRRSMLMLLALSYNLSMETFLILGVEWTLSDIFVASFGLFCAMWLDHYVQNVLC